MRDGRLRRLVGGLGLGYVHTAVAVLVGLWLAPYLIGRLGTSDYGLWLLGTQLVFYLGLMDLGVVALVPREVAAASGTRAGDRLERLRSLIGQTTGLVLWQLPAVALAGAVVLWLLPPDWAPLRGPILASVVLFVVAFPCRIPLAVLQGLQDLTFVGTVQLLSWAAGVGATVSAVAAGLGLYALAAGWGVTQVVSAAMAWRRLTQAHPDVLPSRLSRLTISEARQRVGRGAWISVEQVAQVLLSGVDLLIVGSVLGPQAVVVYACTGKLLTLLANQSQMVMHLALPGLSELRASATRERLFDVSRGLMQVVFLAGGAIATVVLVANETFVGWWVGDRLFGGTGLTALLLAGMLLRLVRVSAGYSLYCFGNERRLAVTSILEGLVAVGTMAVLVPVWGLHGAALGPIAAVCLVGLPGHLVALAREEGVPLSSSLAPLRPWAVRLTVLLVLTSGMVSLGPAAGVPSLALLVVAATGIYLCVMRPVLVGAPLGPMLAERLGPWMSLVPGFTRRVHRLGRA